MLQFVLSSISRINKQTIVLRNPNRTIGAPCLIIRGTGVVFDWVRRKWHYIYSICQLCFYFSSLIRITISHLKRNYRMLRMLPVGYGIVNNWYMHQTKGEQEQARSLSNKVWRLDYVPNLQCVPSSFVVDRHAPIASSWRCSHKLDEQMCNTHLHICSRHYTGGRQSIRCHRSPGRERSSLRFTVYVDYD